MANNPINEGSAWDRFLDMFEQSIIIQSIITFLLISTLCFLWIYGAINTRVMADVIPNELLQVTFIVLGFWFGQKTQVAGRSQASDIAYRLAQAQTAAITTAASSLPRKPDC